MPFFVFFEKPVFLGWAGQCVFLIDSQTSRGADALEWPKCGLQAEDKGKSVSVCAEY